MIKSRSDFLPHPICQFGTGKPRRGNGISDRDFDGSAAYMIGLWRQHRPGSSNRHRHNLSLRFGGQHETAPFERLDTAVKAGSTFGKDHHWRPALDRFRRLSYGFDGRMRIFSIYRNVARTPQMPPQKWISEQLLLRRKPELK